MTPTYKTRCTALTRKGSPCRATAVTGSDPPRCSAHGGRLTDRTLANLAQPAGPTDEIPNDGQYDWAAALTSAAEEEPAAPPLPSLPTVDALQTVDDAMTYLARNIILLDHVILSGFDRLSVNELARLSSTQGANLARYVRMHRDKAVLNGDIDAQSESEIAEALRMVSEQLELEVQL